MDIWNELLKRAWKTAPQVVSDKRFYVARSKKTNKAKVIGIGDLGSETSNSLALAHELGHCVAFRRYSAEQAATYFRHNSEYLITRMFGCMPSKPCAETIYADEVNAWREAGKLLKRLGFKEWRQFNQQRSECLRTYSALP